MMGVLLKREGVVQEPESTGHVVQRLTRSFLKPFELRVRRAIGFDDVSVWQNEESFSLEDEAEGVLFDGVVKSNRRDGSVRRDETSYVMTGLEGRAERVVFEKDGSARVVYNARPEEAATGDYEASRAGMSVGEILADVLDTMRVELAGVLGDGSPGSGYDADELGMLSMVPPKVTFDGCSVPECVRLLMRFHPRYGVLMDPAAGRLRVVDLGALEEHVVTVGSDAVVEAHLDFSTRGCFSACKVEGAGELVDKEVELEPDWDTELEATWTMQQAYEEPETYGRVWRRFVCPDHNLAPYRAVGDSPRILVVVNNGWQKLYLVLTEWADVDYAEGAIELPWLARQWDAGSGAWETAAVRMRYTYRYGPVTARWPRSGFEGTAYVNRGLEREGVLVDHDAMRVTVEGRVDRVESTTSFRSFLIGLKPGELAGKEISFGGQRYTISGNDRNLIELESGPPLLEAGDEFTVYIQDDTEWVYEGGTISKMELRAREWLRGRCDERYEGVVPLSGIDLTVRLGQKVSFAGTSNPFYATLGATLVAVVHDFEHERTELVLTSERDLGGQQAWKDEFERIVAEQERRNLASEVVLLRRVVARRRPLLFDGDRDPRMEAAPESPLRSIGKYGEEGVLTGDAKLEEDDESTPSVAVTRVPGHNSLRVGATFAEEILPVTLGTAVLGDTNRLADAGHRHRLVYNFTLQAAGGGDTLSHAFKEAFGGVPILGVLSLVWDNTYGHILDVTGSGT